MVFVTAGMGGGTGTGAAPVIARVARELGILTVGVVTKPFHFEGQRRMRTAEGGITELQKCVDTLLIIPNQNLFRVANEKTTFADAFAMADQVLYSGVACITDLMVKEGLINLDFADVRAVMREMGKAMMGTGEAEGDKRAMTAAEAAISNPLIDDASMKGARGLLISITGGRDLKLYEVDEAATRIREEVDQEANIIVGATFDESLDGIIRVSVVATGIDQDMAQRRAAAGGRAAHRRSRRNACAPTTSAGGRTCRSGRRRLRARRCDTARRLPAPAPAAPRPSTSIAIGRQGRGRGRDPAAGAARRRHDPAARRRSRRCSSSRPSAPEPQEPQPMPAAFIPPQPERRRRARRACRGSTNCRSRRKTKSGPARRAAAGRPPREAAHDTVAAAGLGRPWPPPARGGSRPAAPRSAPACRQPAGAAGRPPMPRARRTARPEPVSEYAKRAAPQGLDQHGRQALCITPT